METISRALLTFLLNSLWQVPLLAAVASVACRAMRSGAAAQRHAVWSIALAAALLLPVASIRTREEPSAPRTAIAPQALPSAPPGHRAPIATPPPEAPAPQKPAISFRPNVALALLAAYLLVILTGAVRFVRAWARTIRIVRGARPVAPNPSLQMVWERCERAFGVRGVELRSTRAVDAPAMAGVVRRKIVVPGALLGETSEDVLATAIGHEMAHAARHDFTRKVLSELLYLPVSFHPAAWFIRRGIERTRELACDELVTRRLLKPAVYARSIVAIAARMRALQQPGYSLGVLDGGMLEERVRRLLEPPRSPFKRTRLVFAAAIAALAGCAIFASGLGLSARAQTGSRAEMTLAAGAYNRADFKTAVEHFENAVRLDPAAIEPKLFLANALMREFFVEKAQPGSPLIERARQEYRDVLALDPANRLAVTGLMTVAIDSRQFAEARQWAQKLIELDPKDKAGYYTAGMLEWAAAYPAVQRAKQAAGGKPEDAWIADPASRNALRERHAPRVEAGVRMLQQAINLDPDYSDAMAYLNLLDRLKAAMASTPAESAALLAEADSWVGKARAARRGLPPRPPEPKTLDPLGPPPGPASAEAVVASPPPPPPPPPPDKALDGPASSAKPSAPRPAAMTGLYWQVTGPDGMSARALMRLVRDRGINVYVMKSGAKPEVLVFAGPYASESAVRDAKRALETAGVNPVRIW